MKSPQCWFLLKGALLIVLLALCLGGSGVVKGDSDPSSISVVQPETLNDPTEPAQGYLQVYSATDEFNDAGLVYYSRSSYSIYTTDGELFKIVENHISPGDDSPELVALPAGSYVVIARSNKHGDVRIRFAIEEGQLTVLDFDLGAGDGQTVTFTRVVTRCGQLIGGSRVQSAIVTSQFYANLHALRYGK